jgi:YVTN family beta-propeller protein/autotransporter-associated beta strand protein
MAVAWLAVSTSAHAQVTSYAVVPNSADGTISIIDTATASVIGSPINLGGAPQCSATTPDGRIAYVTIGVGGSVAKIDLAAATMLTLVTVGTLPTCLVLTPDGTKAYITDAALNQVIPFDVATDTPGTGIAVGNNPNGIAIAPDGAHLYVANNVDNTVSVLDTATDTVTATVPVGTGPSGLIVTPDGTTAYVANTVDGTVTPIALATNTAGTPITVGTQPSSIAVTTDGTTLVVTDLSSTTISSIDVATTTVTPASVGTSTFGVAITPNGTAWVLDTNTNSAIPVTVSTLTPGTSVGVGLTPTAWEPFIGPNLIVPTGSPLVISGDGDLVTGGFGSTYADFNGGALQLSANWTSARTLSLLGTGGVIDTNGNTATLTGATVGSGGLTKTGTGRLILSGIAAHTGTTTLNDGILEINGTHTTASVTMYLATLAGSGTIGDVGMFCSGTISPGGASTTGILTAGHVAMDAGTTLAIRLNGPAAGTDYDRLNATSGVDLNGATLSVSLGYTPNGGESYTIATNANGTFDGLAEGASLTLGGKLFHLTYQGGSGSDVVLTYDAPPTLTPFSNVTRPAPAAPVAIPFTVTDDLVNPTVTATSSNQALVPNANLVITGVCATRTLTVTAKAHQSGQALITVTASDGSQTMPQTFLFTITDGPPTLQPIADQTIGIGATLGPLALVVSDDVNLTADLSITATSSNHSLVTDNNIVIFGGATPKLSIAPATHIAGQTTITVTVTDGSSHSVQQSFLLTVTDQPPTITGLGDQTIIGGSTLGPIAFTVADDVTAASALTVSATSSNSTLLPNVDLLLGGSGGARTLTASPVLGQSGSTQITVSASDGTHTTNATFMLTVTDAPVYFLAEGATGSFFSTDILIANPNLAAAPVTMTFYKDDATTVVKTLTLLATSRTTVHVADIAGMESAAFATSVASTGGLPLVVERTMTWDASGYGSHGEKASAGAATTWYFAEGSQGFFHTFFLLLNPHATTNVAHVTFFLEDGSPLQRNYPLAAASRTTLDIATEPALANRSFGAVITFDLPGMAERAMYFGDSPAFSGGTDASGVTAPATSWFLAEGATGSFFDTFILIANPNDTAANVTTTYLPASGVPVPKIHVVAPHQRLTLNIATEDPTLASVAVATSVSSDVPVIAERSQYWPHANWYEAHNSAGETTAGLKWGLAEGRVGGTAHAQTYVLIANPGTQPANVTATFLRTDGTTIVKTLTVAATSRTNIAITGPGSDVPELVDEAFSTVIQSSQPVIVERSMYTDANGVTWAAGTNATASRLP